MTSSEFTIFSQVNENEVKNKEDIIPAWYFDDKGNKVFLYLDEKTALNSIRPVLIINADKFDETFNYVNIKDHLVEKKINSIKSIPYIDEYSISERYDKSKNSEYSYKLVYEYSGDGTQEGGKSNRN